MSTDRETARLVRSWLDEGVTRLPDRVLDAVLDQIPTTPQRRSGWSAWRSYRMTTYAKVAIAAAAVLVVAVVGYQFLPRNGGIGGQPTVGPSPSPAPLAHGTFQAKGADVELDAAGDGDHVTGTMVVTDEDGAFTVDLGCARTTEADLLWIGGDVTESTWTDLAPTGTRAAIVLKRGAPVEALFMFQFDDPESASCLAFFDDMIRIGGMPKSGPDGLEPIVGTVELAP